MSKGKRKVGLLTGTFDPVHLGHVAIARAAMGVCGLHEVWFLVNSVPRHKTGVAMAYDRIAMVRIALEHEPGMREGDPAGVGAAHHRMADFDRLTAHYPDCDFVFIIGTDVLAVMDQWEDKQPAIERAVFVVARRAGAEEIFPSARLRLQMFEVKEHAAASSRVIQGQLAAGERPLELDLRVYDYILKRGLYT